MNLYLGKLSKNYPEQLSESFYAAGEQGISWYGGIQPGEYVFPVFEGKIHKLWKVREYGQKVNRVGKDNPGVVFFDTIKEFSKPISLADEFIRYRYFDLDLTLLNKSSKSVKGIGFHKIPLAQNCPPPEQMDFGKDKRKILITLPAINSDLTPADGDIRILIDNHTDMKIQDIQIFTDNQFVRYELLWNLYSEKNADEKRYSIKQLLEYSKEDHARKKENYLSAVIKELDSVHFFSVTNPIALYDNLLVGRKVTQSSAKGVSEPVTTEYDSETEAEEYENLDEYKPFVELLENNPNLILYGPPGTGKTFISRKIVEAFDLTKTGTFKDFTTIQKEGRAKFITFHQAYSYEEFVEGIRPVFDSSEENEDSSIKYKVEDGIIKQLANSASKQEINKSISSNSATGLNESSQIWKVSLGQKNVDSQVYQVCKKKNEIAIGWLPGKSLEGKGVGDIYDMLIEARKDPAIKPIQDANSINVFVNEMKLGDIVFIYDSPTAIRDIGIITGDYKYDNSQNNFAYNHRRKVKWLKEFDKPFDIFEMNGKKRLTLKTIYPLNSISFSDLKKIIDVENGIAGNEKNHIAYYLIIDEINRGNISKIFGELITLIEKDKRAEISCHLPYSQKEFYLPSNIYIIGTMNTADRSLAVLDTALRRRFTFCEVEPDPEIFTKTNSTLKINDKVNLQELLTYLNKKITEKLDRDHRIGHSYFMRIESLAQLHLIWYYKIIPLLLEYFYNEIEKIEEIIKEKLYDGNQKIKVHDYKVTGIEASAFENFLINMYEKNGRQ